MNKNFEHVPSSHEPSEPRLPDQEVYDACFCELLIRDYENGVYNANDVREPIVRIRQMANTLLKDGYGAEHVTHVFNLDIRDPYEYVLSYVAKILINSYKEQ